MKTEKNKAIDEAKIRQLIDGWVKAVHAKDINVLMSYYAPDIVLFDLPAPTGSRCI